MFRVGVPAVGAATAVWGCSALERRASARNGRGSFGGDVPRGNNGLLRVVAVAWTLELFSTGTDGVVGSEGLGAAQGFV